MTTPQIDERLARAMLARAARLGSRGHGAVEPNPMVGCVICDASGAMVGSGYHRRYGGPHAEVEALRDAGSLARGGTVYVTLEPCNHSGKTPPCSEALIEAGVARVVYGRPDPNPEATGGAKRLTDAGIEVHFVDEPNARRLSEPWAHRLATGLPWVIAKWAQTLDGCVATRTGESQWISNERSRAMVHRERGRVDAIVTGIGTVLADDPQLTARRVRSRRQARRIVVDHKLQTPLQSNLVRSAGTVPTTIACIESLLTPANESQWGPLESMGVELVGIPLAGDASTGDEPGLSAVFRAMVDRYDITTMMVESGGGLLGRLFREDLVCAAWIFTAPMVLGDADGIAPVRGGEVPVLADATRLRLVTSGTRGDDVVSLYHVGK